MALLLTREIGEKLVINKDIVIEIVSLNRGQVRMAITAPRSVTIDREEIHQQKENNSESINESNLLKKRW